MPTSLDTSRHDVKASAALRALDAQRTRAQWQTALLDFDNNDDDAVSSRPGGVSDDVTDTSSNVSRQTLHARSPLDPDIIISKPPSGPPSIYVNRRRETETPAGYEPSFAAVGNGIKLSKFQQPSHGAAPSQPVPVALTQPMFTSRSEQNFQSPLHRPAPPPRVAQDDTATVFPRHSDVSDTPPWAPTFRRHSRPTAASSDVNGPTYQVDRHGAYGASRAAARALAAAEQSKSRRFPSPSKKTKEAW